jgi:ABC-2 type transport system ATP-binding protein
VTGNSIEVEGVSKRFRLSAERHSSLKERVVGRGRRQPAEELWALRDVSFEVPEGKTVGLLGHNGSGKSTLLKCVGGILQPTEGVIRTSGRLASLLELGAGFHPDLTGRENVFLNASILGMSKRDIELRFDDIVGFAELERFIDQQVKHYSSGMYVRLGFSVATNVDPDVLLVDEVLSVGDEAFQRKCLDRVRQFQRDGRTIVFVTHAADQVRQICDLAAVLDRGELVTWGTPSEAVRVFREGLLSGSHGADGSEGRDGGPERKQRAQITGVDIRYPDGRPYVVSGGELEVRVTLDAEEPVDDCVVALALHATDGHVVYGTSTWAEGLALDLQRGPAEVTFRFPTAGLLEGVYPLTIGLHGRDGGEVHDWREQHENVDVLNPPGGFRWGVVDLDVAIQIDPPEAASPTVLVGNRRERPGEERGSRGAEPRMA